MNNKKDYNNHNSKYAFMCNKKALQDFQVTLRSKYNLTMSSFFRKVMESVIDDEPVISEFILNYLDEEGKMSKTKRLIIDKVKEDSDKLMEDFELTENELEEYFDIFDENFKDF